MLDSEQGNWGKTEQRATFVNFVTVDFVSTVYFSIPTSENLSCTSLAISFLFLLLVQNQIASTAVLRSISKGTLLP